MIVEELKYIKRNPTLVEFKALRQNAGWGMPPDAAIETGLKNTLFSVYVEDSEGHIIGMGRIVGDGGIQILIADVIIHKDWQRKGIGTGIMNILMDYARMNYHSIFISLFATVGREKFYKKFGFRIRPNSSQGAGMNITLPKPVEPEP